MRSAYLDYAMSVIVGRALPDVRDGLKPVHRRVLFSMSENGLTPTRPYRKCASIVGDVMGNYHPHGDSAIYDALARLAQDFSMRYDARRRPGQLRLDRRRPASRDALLRRRRDARRDPRGQPCASPISPTASSPTASATRTCWCTIASGARCTRRRSSTPATTRRCACARGRASSSPERTTTPCCASSTWSGSRCCMWKQLDELAAGDRVLISRTPRMPGEELSAERARAAPSCSARSCRKASRARRERASTTSITSSSTACWQRTTTMSADRATSTSARSALAAGCASSTSRTSTSFRASPLACLIGPASRAKHVPELVWRGPPAFKRAFLQALFTGDGSSSLLPRSTIQVSYSSYSERLAGEVQRLLLEFGVIGRICGPTAARRAQGRHHQPP